MQQKLYNESIIKTFLLPVATEKLWLYIWIPFVFVFQFVITVKNEWYDIYEMIY